MRTRTTHNGRPPQPSARLRLGLLRIAALGVAIAACGGSDDPGPDDGEDDGPIAVAPAVPEGVAPLPPDGELKYVDSHGVVEPGGFATVYLMPGTDEAATEKVFEAVDAVLSSSEFSYSIETREPFVNAMLEPGLFDTHPDLLPCYRFDVSPRLDIELKEPDAALLQAMADAIRDHPAVFSVESFGLEFGFTVIPEERAIDAEGRELGYDEFLAETCESGQIWLLVDPTLDDDARQALAERILVLPAVAGVLMDRSFEEDGEFFRPDLSDYPTMATCDGPATSSLRAIIPSADRASADEVVNAFVDDPRVVGFLGRHVDESLDPILAWEQEVDFELCERLTAHVELITEISDTDAAIVVARALAVPGVADIELNLFDPAPPEGCEDFEGEGDFDSGAPSPPGDAMGVVGNGGSLGGLVVSRRENIGAALVAFSPVFDPCFVPETSGMVIYRGDPDLATQRILADALCDLPGVLSIGSFDEVITDADPYADCQALYLDVRLAADSNEAAGQTVRNFLGASDNVLEVTLLDEFYAREGYERPIPEIVVGEMDLFACDPELAYESGAFITSRLARITEQQARSLADELLAMPGVVDVFGNAVRHSLDSAENCGIDFMWFWFTPNATDAERSAVLAVFAARSDVLAVALLDESNEEEAHVGTESGTVDIGWSGTVTFTSEEPPADLDSLIEQIRSMPGVAYAEAIYGEGGDVFEG